MTKETEMDLIFKNCIVKCQCLGDNFIIEHDPYRGIGNRKSIEIELGLNKGQKNHDN